MLRTTFSSGQISYSEGDAHGCLWDEARVPRAPAAELRANIKRDVVIVGGGLTGLWSALALKEKRPELGVAILEAAQCGFGASGRNGGWCSALFPEEMDHLTDRVGYDLAAAQYEAMRAAVTWVGEFTTRHGIECDFHLGGTLMLATNPAQVDRLRTAAEHSADHTWLSTEHARVRVRPAHLFGASYTPNCAAIHPRKLVDGLVALALERGVEIFEQSPVIAISPGSARTSHGSVRAPAILRCTEAYTTTLKGHRRALLPIYSLMIATEPLTESTWDRIGLANRETFSDGRHLLIYGQRTADNRFAFGGRGAPYHFGSRISSGFDSEPGVFDNLAQTLYSLFPQVAQAAITHRWGGPLGVSRDWTASVGFDRISGLGWAGGYVGDGVSTTSLAGRTLADLVLQEDTDLTQLPWVGHRSRHWEPEPFRFLGVNAGRSLAATADWFEDRSQRPARRTEWLMKQLLR